MGTHVTRRSARAILIDGTDLLLIKRTRPGQMPYKVTIGGGIEPEDASVEDALRREVLEEIGAQIDDVTQVLVIQDPVEEGIAIQHICLARVAPVGFVEPTGEQLDAPGRGGYELVRVPFTSEGLRGIDLKPAALAEYLSANCDALLATLGYPTASPRACIEREDSPA
ncbi:NUDIX domain-containing protein [Actinospica sp. MGRD01-02]|uniref:NUDIX domain-containing protein n=1 Tax=Actinospica acidithermotolerans TaxID=2828514 RepID=A0A941E9Q2_9ACTN|nr:NUDIX domain-containing protein [Actinospica acidithermotolerans]MBR7827571.1 NUDIX domain-containing protein [Actinospica acidithermotolerans]